MVSFRGTTASLVLLVALTVACDNDNPLAPTPATPVTPVEPTEVTIAVVLPHRSDEILPGTFAAYGINYFGVEGANVTCLDGCPDRQTQPTDDQGEVTFLGMPTLRVRVEKAGYIPVTRTVSVDGEANGEVVVSHEWPAELAVAIRQLELGAALLRRRLFRLFIGVFARRRSLFGSFCAGTAPRTAPTRLFRAASPA